MREAAKSPALYVAIALALLSAACDGFTDISGRVTDADGHPLYNANVTLQTEGQKEDSKTGPDGHYDVGMVHSPFRIGLTLDVSKEGYQPYHREFSSADGLRRVDVTLEWDAEKQGVPAPTATWTEGFFEEIDGRAAKSEVKDLRAERLRASDLEARVWVGFGSHPLEGFIIRKSGGRWSGQLLPSLNFCNEQRFGEKPLAVNPPAGWPRLWEALEGEGIRTLPDGWDFKNESQSDEAESCVVEIAEGSAYRAYIYLDPRGQNRAEAAHVVNIVNVLRSQFAVEGLNRCPETPGPTPAR